MLCPRMIPESRRYVIRSALLTLAAGWFLAAQTAVSDGQEIELTSVPPYDSQNNLEGVVRGVDVSTHKVAVFIFPGAWWNKPTFAEPLTPIRADGTWTCNITTGGPGSYDSYATKIAAFLVPQQNASAVPLLHGANKLPPDLFNSTSIANVIVNRPPGIRTIRFSGYDWTVKLGETNQLGPGPNYFSDDGVFVDGQGRLHLTIRRSGDRWSCSEIVCNKSFGYGRYVLYLSSPVDHRALDPNVVLGLFTWEDDAVDDHYREIDIEFSTWGGDVANDQDGQFVIQPHDAPNGRNREQFNVLSVAESAHWFDWRANAVAFRSVVGHNLCTQKPGDVIHEWTNTGPDVPSAGGESARINLWLYQGNPPTNGQDVEIIIDKFQFIPFPSLSLDIKANGSDGPVTVGSTDPLSVQVALDPGSFLGLPADWWLVAVSPFGLYSYDAASVAWRPGLAPAYQGSLSQLPPCDVLRVTGLPEGTYAFYFGIDLNQNRRIDDDLFLGWDEVHATILP